MSAEAFAFHAPPLPHLSLFAVFSDLSISSFISPPHSSYSPLHITWPLLSPNLLWYICLDFHSRDRSYTSQSQGATDNLNPFGHCRGGISAACSSHSQVTSNRSWPLTLCIWWMRRSLQMTSRPEWHWLRPVDICINCAKIKGVFISPDHYWLDTKAQRWISDTVSSYHLYLYTELYYARILESIIKSLI